MKTSTITAAFNSPVQAVWDIVTNNKNFAWRSDLSNIVVSDDEKSFSEFAKNGFETKFTITEKTPCKRYEFDILNANMSGHWVGVFSEIGTGTQIEFTEQVSLKNPIMKLFAKLYLKKQQTTYISDLKKALGE